MFQNGRFVAGCNHGHAYCNIYIIIHTYTYMHASIYTEIERNGLNGSSDRFIIHFHIVNYIIIMMNLFDIIYP